MDRSSRLNKTDWFRTGFLALLDQGESGLKAEPLARRLNTTKGSFYWHFANIGQFKSSMLEHWEQQAFDDVVALLEDEPSIPKRLRSLGQVAANPAWLGYEGAPIEPAIRAWARSDPLAAETVQRIDARRLAYLESLLVEIGLTNSELARIIYAGLIGLEDLSSRDGLAVQESLGTLIDLVLALR